MSIQVPAKTLVNEKLMWVF